METNLWPDDQTTVQEQDFGGQQEAQVGVIRVPTEIWPVSVTVDEKESENSLMHMAEKRGYHLSL